MATILTAKHAGACYGVERAMRMVEKCMEEGGRVHTIGPLIHNPRVVARLAERGVTAIAEVSDAEVPSTVVIRSHGVVPSVVREAHERGLNVVDATCPHVKKAHEAAAMLSGEGYQVIVVGEEGHPEVEGILARAGEDAVVVGSVEALDALQPAKKVGVVVQTTQSRELLSSICARLVGRVREMRVMNTVCAATMERQRAARDLAGEVDVMVVVGGKNSGNTRRLAEVCLERCARTHHIETVGELDAAWFAGAGAIGVTAGASTPADQVQEVVDALGAITAAEEGCDHADA